jgi:serine/threonine-protein kinase
MRVAIKYLYCDEEVFDPELVADFQREVAMHYELRGLPGIVIVYGYIVDETTRPKPTYAIVMEFMESSVYAKFVKKDARKADMRTKLQLLHQLAIGVKHLHAESIVHLDIKSLNALLDKDGNAKWTDFGLAHIRKATGRTITSSRSRGDAAAVETGGSLFWMAPELFMMKKPSQATDMYAFGILQWEVLAQLGPGCCGRSGAAA